ncbi:hypothetical protein AAFF_G00266040 [Aldrovandia affinis]|uniref:Uncharacterized protein n=1 Tax=Aldrovandia affinis TaxID=143900 RepID=A0AAD7RBL0_9TELE|nr:hypothetical protein AAFF_G00266040 [Aldrovandia affinis]
MTAVSLFSRDRGAGQGLDFRGTAAIEPLIAAVLTGPREGREGGVCGPIVARFVGGKTREGRGHKAVNGNSSPCVPLLTAPGRPFTGPVSVKCCFLKPPPPSPNPVHTPWRNGCNGCAFSP